VQSSPQITKAGFLAPLMFFNAGQYHFSTFERRQALGTGDFRSRILVNDGIQK
jgi:hypothetical protein